MDTRGDFTKQLMDFRTNYLRAVARASVDLPFRQELTQPGNAFEVLRKAFGYECPWSLTLKLCDNSQTGPRLNPASGRVMTLPYWGESLTIYIPHKPKYDDSVPYEVQVQNQLDALAAYYNQNTWLLQNKPENEKALNTKGATAPSQTDATDPNPLGHPDPPKIFERKWSLVSKKDRYDLGDDVNDFISFAAAIFNAVALAWQDQLMWNELTAYKGGLETESRARTISILNEWLGYNYPWELDLVIKADDTATYVPYKPDDENAGKWIKTTPPELMLTLPWMSGVDIDPKIKSEDPLEVRASKFTAATEKAAKTEVDVNLKNPGLAIMGLALYNTNGPGYPFTCG